MSTSGTKPQNESRVSRSFSAFEFERNYGSVTQIVRGGTPVLITSYGRADFMLLPVELAERALQALAELELQEAVAEKSQSRNKKR